METLAQNRWKPVCVAVMILKNFTREKNIIYGRGSVTRHVQRKISFSDVLNNLTTSSNAVECIKLVGY